MKRPELPTSEFILLSLTGTGIFAVTPFAIIRMMDGHWQLFLLDLALVAGLVALFVYTLRTHNVRAASLAVCLICQVAIVGTIYIQGTEQLFWAYPAVIIAYYLVSPRLAFITSVVAIAVLTPIIVAAMDAIHLATVYTTLIVTIAFSHAFSALTRVQQQQMEVLTKLDPLTGAGNRRAMRDKLQEIVARHHRQPVVATLLLIDLDHFKSINDVFGHAAGDDTLIGVVDVIRRRIRETDSVYRFGGEEFVVVAEGSDARVGATLAEDLRQLVETETLIDQHTVTISIGIAQLVAGESTDGWLRRADEALYAAKDAGRNATVRAPVFSEAELEAAAASSGAG